MIPVEELIRQAKDRDSGPDDSTAFRIFERSCDRLARFAVRRHRTRVTLTSLAMIAAVAGGVVVTHALSFSSKVSHVEVGSGIATVLPCRSQSLRAEAPPGGNDTYPTFQLRLVNIGRTSCALPNRLAVMGIDSSGQSITLPYFPSAPATDRFLILQPDSYVFADITVIVGCASSTGDTIVNLRIAIRDTAYVLATHWNQIVPCRDIGLSTDFALPSP